MSTEEKKRDLAALALSTSSGLAGLHRARSVANLQYNTHVHVYNMDNGHLKGQGMMLKVQGTILSCVIGHCSELDRRSTHLHLL